MTIQRSPIPTQNEAKYLVVTLTAASNYLEGYERTLRMKAVRGRGMMTHQALWSFNRIEVLRALWKMVVVMGLTYAKAVMCVSAGTREALERRRRDAGRMALGAHRGVVIEGIQG
ncbi:hypothetical protein HPB48_022480 [Haemaphysalis longicornis]|uniref:Uncharacterized protein n=1 Tax=Haemaphysalis longicornis TaxID=44386 RepID=A0A9J6G0K1_HAELO|nr:hypothetical protein HPB48_022480 [Haemaphysalis longicornis]